MDYRILDTFTETTCQEAVLLHQKQLSYRSFIASFGPKFLLTLYRDILNDELGFLVLASHENELCGFILACTDTQKVFRLIKRHFFKYCRLMLPRIAKKPFLLKKIAGTLFYTRSEKSNVVPELLVIAVDTRHQSRGVGTELLSRMESEFVRKGVRQYKVTVHQEMLRSNSFYANHGCELAGRFKMYGVFWNLYTKKI